MLFNLKALINWNKLSIKKQKLVDKTNPRENKNRIDFDYKIGQKIYIKNDGVQRKMDYPKEGPFEITDVFKNSTVRIQCDNVKQCINI